MQTIERLARTRGREDARYMARLVWPGLTGLAGWFAWFCLVLLDLLVGHADHADPGTSFDALETALIVVAMAWWLLHPLALLCLLLATIGRGRHRWSAILANGSFLLVSAFMLGSGTTCG